MNSCDRWYYLENFYDSYCSDLVVPPVNGESGLVGEKTQSSSVTDASAANRRQNKAARFYSESIPTTEIGTSCPADNETLASRSNPITQSINNRHRIPRPQSTRVGKHHASDSGVSVGSGTRSSFRSDIDVLSRGLSSGSATSTGSEKETSSGTTTTNINKRVGRLFLRKGEKEFPSEFQARPISPLSIPTSTSSTEEAVSSKMIDEQIRNNSHHSHSIHKYHRAFLTNNSCSSGSAGANSRGAIPKNRKPSTSSTHSTSSSSGHGSSTDNHNSDTEFDLDPLPERDERFWLSANDVSLTSLSSTQLQQHLSHAALSKSGGGATRTNKFKDKKFRRKKSGDDDIMTMTLTSSGGNTTTPLCLLGRGNGDGYGDCNTESMGLTGAAVITRKKSGTNNNTNNNSGTSNKSNSFATVRRRLSKPLITNSSINCNKTGKSCSSRRSPNVEQSEPEGAGEENQSGSSCSVSSESSSSSVSLSKSKPRSLSLPEKVWNELLQINSSHNKAGRRNSLWTSSRRALKCSAGGTGPTNENSPTENSSEKRSKKYSSEINIFTAPKKPARRIFMMGDLARNKTKDKEISSSPAGSSSGISSAALEIELEEVAEDAVKTNGNSNALTTTPNKSKLKRTKSGGNKWKFFIGRFQRARSGSGGSDVSCDTIKSSHSSNGSPPNGKLRVSVRRRGSISANNKNGLKSRAATIHSFEPVSEVTGSCSSESSLGIGSSGVRTTISTPEDTNKTRRLSSAPKLFKSFRLKKNKVAIGKEPEAPLENQNQTQDTGKEKQRAKEKTKLLKSNSKLKLKAQECIGGIGELGDGRENDGDAIKTTEEKIAKIKTPSILRRKLKTTKDKDKSANRPLTVNKIKSSKHLLSTFYIGNKDRLSLNDFDDVTLDLASGELVNTADGTVIVQTDIVARAKVNSSNTRLDKSNNKLTVSAGLHDENEDEYQENGDSLGNLRISISRSCEDDLGCDRMKIEIKNPSSVEDVDSSPLSVAGQSSSSTPTASCSSSGAVGIPGSSTGRARALTSPSEVTSGESPKKFFDRVKKGLSFSNGSSVGSGNRRRKSSRNNPVSDGNGVDCSLHHPTTQQRHHQQHPNASSDDVDGGNIHGKKTDGIDDGDSRTGEASMRFSSEEEEALSINSCDTRNEDDGEGYNGPFDGRAVALVDSTPNAYDRHALRFKKGDIIDIISKNRTGLWTGKVNNQVGHFKFISVRVLPSEMAEADDGSYADTGNCNCSIHCSHSPAVYTRPSGQNVGYGHYRHNSELGESPDQNNLNRSCYQHGRRNNKRLTPLSPWELEERQTVANVINGILQESCGGAAGEAAGGPGEDGVANEHRSSALNQSANNGAEAESESQQKARKDKAERKKCSLKKGRPKSVGDLLKRINLQEHTSVFYLHGFETLDLFKGLKEEDLDELAITNLADRTKILTAVDVLQYTEEDEYLGEHSQQRRIMVPSNFSRYPRDSGIFVGKCDADMDGDDGCESVHHEASSLQSESPRDLEPAAETEEIILSPINLQKATTAAYPYANRSRTSPPKTFPQSENITILESKSKKPNAKMFSRNTIMANAEQEYNDFWPVNENNSISRQMIKGHSNSSSSFDGTSVTTESSSSNHTSGANSTNSQDPESYVDVRQRFLQARSIFEKSDSQPLPTPTHSTSSPTFLKAKDEDKTGNSANSRLSPAHNNENRFLFSEKSNDSPITSTSTNKNKIG